MELKRAFTSERFLHGAKEDGGVLDVALATISIVLCLILASAVFTVTAASTNVTDAASVIARNEARAIESSNSFITTASLNQIAQDTLGSSNSISISSEAIPLGGQCPSEYYAIRVTSQLIPFITASITQRVPLGLNLGGC